MNKSEIKNYIIGVILLFTSVALILNCGRRNPFPKTISGCPLVKTYHGQLAQTTLNDHHEQPVAPASNTIGFYENDTCKLTIYISTFENKEIAADAFHRMVVKITPFNTRFGMGKYIVIDGKDIFRYPGIFDHHFVFTKKNQVIWLAVKNDSPLKYLTYYVRYIY